MLWRAAGILIFIAAMITGCASAPTDAVPENDAIQAADVAGSVAENTGVIEEALSDTDTELKVGCRKESTTGSHVKRVTCKPAKDDSELIPLISAPRH